MAVKHTIQMILVGIGLAASGMLLGFRPAGERSAMSIRYIIDRGSQLSLQGTTNINSFECFSKQAFNQQSVQVMVDPISGTVTFDRAVLQLQVASLDCDNNKINADLCDALDSEEFPHITIELLDARLVNGSIAGEWSDIIVNATLKITDRSRKIEFRAKGKHVEGNRYRFVASKGLKMTDYGVEPPTALMGLIRVRDEITINLDIVTKVRFM